MQSMASQTIDPGKTGGDPLWPLVNFTVTPVARQIARLMRADAQSSDEFHCITYLYEVSLKVETTIALAYLRLFDKTEFETLGYSLVYADGVGIWVDVLQKAINALSVAGKTELIGLTRSFTQKLRSDGKDADPVQICRDVWDELGEVQFSFSRTRLGVFQFLVALRNRTRGHGAPTDKLYEAIDRPLIKLLTWLLQSSPFLSLELVKPMKLKDGTVYSSRLLLGYPTQSQTLVPSKEIDDSQLLYVKTPNGYLPLPDFIIYDRADDSCWILNSARKLSNGESDYLDYLNNTKRSAAVKDFREKPVIRPASSTAGLDSLDWDSTPVNNLPSVDFSTYVQRRKLEEEVHGLLTGNTVNFISLAGAGGVGKTTLAIRVARRLINEGSKFDFILWFSARDVDLDERAGPLQRRRQVTSLESCANLFCKLVEPLYPRPDEATSVNHFAGVLSSGNDRFILIFDNFESFDDTAELQAFIKTNLGPTSKALITNRERSFHGDWPIEIAGLSRDETRDLIVRTSRQAGCEPRITESIVDRIFETTLGNPYAVKLLVNELARTASFEAALPQALGEDYLATLFRRSFERAPDEAQYLFLVIALSPIARDERLCKILMASHNFVYDEAKHAVLESHLLDPPDKAGPRDNVYRVSWAAQKFAERIVIGHWAQRNVERDVMLMRELAQEALASSSSVEMLKFFLQRSTDAKVMNDPVLREQNANIADWLREHDGDAAAYYALNAQHLGVLSVDSRRAAFKQAVELQTGNPELWIRWADLEEEEGDYERALDLNLRALDQSETVSLLVRVGRNINRILTDFKDIVSVGRRQVYTGSVIDRLANHVEHLDAEQLSVIFWLYLISNDRVNAKRCLEQGLKRFPEDHTLRRLLSKL